MYDYLIVGAGMYGSVFAREMTDRGKRCLVIDQLNHIGGHCYTKEIEGIVVHQYGPHIFHTSDREVWDYVQKYCVFRPYCHRVKAFYQGKIYSFPINLMTLYQLWGVQTPAEALQKLEEKKVKIHSPQNLEEWALSQVGEEIYEIFFRGYTKKQWGRSPKELDPFVIKRLPIRYSFNDTYYNDIYQGIPEGGYTRLFANLLDGIEVRLEQNYFDQRSYWNSLAKKVLFTGRVDEFFDFSEGILEYRSLRFETEVLPMPDFQGTSVMNYTDEAVPFTRITEYQHFEPKNLSHTVISREYSDAWSNGKTPYYPVNTDQNNAIAQKYFERTKQLPDILFGGRLAEFKYYDMHQIIAAARQRAKNEA